MILSEHTPLSDPVLGGVHAAVFGSDTKAATFFEQGRVMGTTARVTTVGGAEDLPRKMMDYLHYLDGLWSRFRADSEISRLNNSPERAVEVSSETLTLISAMMAGAKLTRGAFDPTLLAAVIDEGYASSLVDSSLVTSLPSSVSKRGNLDHVSVIGHTVTLPTGTSLDSGGVGKGLAADLAVALASSEGALGALVEVGGDVRVQGSSPRGNSWRLAIEHPNDPTSRLGVVELDNRGLATSTVAKRRFMVDGRSTHHLIDPGTLKSTQSDTVQASVIARTAAEAEMWTKVAFVRGSEELLAAAQANQFQAACLLDSGDWVTSKKWVDADA